MGLKNSNFHYSPWIIGLHWLMLVLLIFVYASMELRGLVPKGSELRTSLKSLHFLLGLCVLLLVMVRIGVRCRSGTVPDIEPPIPIWQIKFVSLMHYALYSFMIAMPLLGWLALSAAGKPIILFGLPLPSLISSSEPLSHQLKEVHEALATVGYILIGLHAAAALIHHYLIRDNTLLRMLPRRSSDHQFK